jgi:hypothetical protein
LCQRRAIYLSTCPHADLANGPDHWLLAAAAAERSSLPSRPLPPSSPSSLSPCCLMPLLVVVLRSMNIHGTEEREPVARAPHAPWLHGCRPSGASHAASASEPEVPPAASPPAAPAASNHVEKGNVVRWKGTHASWCWSFRLRWRKANCRSSEARCAGSGGCPCSPRLPRARPLRRTRPGLLSAVAAQAAAAAPAATPALVR